MILSPWLRSLTRRPATHNRSHRRVASRRSWWNRSAVIASVEKLEDRTLLAAFSSGDIPKTIVDQSTVTSTLSVPDSITIDDINVTLNITHTRTKDLDVFLIAPGGGTQVQLFADVGGNGDHFTGTTLDDEAATPITSGSVPSAAAFVPRGR